MSNGLSLRWLSLLVVTVVAMLAATSFGDIRIHLIIAAICALIFAVYGVRQTARLTQQGASEHAVGAASAQSMGLVWLWGAAILGISYLALIKPWSEWLHFFGAFAAVGILCLLFARTLERDAASGTSDHTMLKLGRILTIGQAVGMLATLVGIGVDPDKSILTKTRPDWAANIVFVFGGLALLVISGFTLWKQRDYLSSE